jgi:hypothetical protein
MLDAALFMVECDQRVQPAAEIEQAVWLEPDAPRDFPIAPLTAWLCAAPAQPVPRQVRQSSRLSWLGKSAKRILPPPAVIKIAIEAGAWRYGSAPASLRCASPQKEKGPTRVGPVWG